MEHQILPYTPQQNGKVKRKNKSLVERARAIISESRVPKQLWGEAIFTYKCSYSDI